MKTHTIITGFALFICLVATSAALAGEFPLPDTGQTTCYNDVGDVITCPQPGEAFYGQDANYTINPPSNQESSTSEGKNR